MVDAAQIREHAEVTGSDGGHVGTVDHLDGASIKLAKRDPDSGGDHHWIPLSWVESADSGAVRLNRSAEQAQREWSDSASS
jgi:hypothetical protein